jgi:hypothetical protein
MTAKLHMMKLAPGVQDRDMMQAWVDQERSYCLSQGLGDTLFLGTKNVPKRAEELLQGGSIYWVWKSQVQARQVIRDITSKEDGNGKTYCLIELDPELIDVSPAPRRPFQGWRYAEVGSVPPDLGGRSEELEGMPEEMKAELARIGIL